MKASTRIIRLLLVDDHPIVRDGIKSHLSAQANLQVIGEADNGLEAIELARQLKPDIILMDVSMPQMNGVEAMRRLRREVPDCKILVLTMHDNKEYISQVIQLGARGYVLKNASPTELVRSIELVDQGEVYLSPSVSRIMLDELVVKKGGAREPAPEPETLSDRETQVLRQIAGGASNKEIAATLGVSVRTVETHRERVMRKLRIHSVAGLTRFAIAKGMVELD